MLKVTLVSAVKFDGWRLKKLQDAVNVMAGVLNSEAFKQKVLNFETPNLSYSTGKLWWKEWHIVPGSDGFQWSYTEMSDGTKNYMTREQVYKWIMLGHSTLEAGPNQEIEIDITLDNQAGVLGWTYPGTIKSWISRWFFDSANTAELAGNLAHEAMHKLGFEHPFNNTYFRNYTVPYAIGFLVQDIAASGKWQLQSEGKPLA